MLKRYTDPKSPSVSIGPRIRFRHGTYETEDPREQALIEGSQSFRRMKLVVLKEDPPRIPKAPGTLTRAELAGMNKETLLALGLELGLQVAKTMTNQALVDAIVAFKPPGAPPADPADEPPKG